MPAFTLGRTRQSIGRYELLEQIAEGGMGTVYRGRSFASGEIVAVKVVPKHVLSSNPTVLKRFEQEYTVARSIDHPNVVRALDFGTEDGTPFLVMEFVEGESLGQKIEREGKIAEDEAIRIIAQVAEGLQRAHELGLVHRDVKPDNVLLTPDGVAKLTDLGLVKEIEADLNLTRTGRGLGTPHFMAPEQFRNAKRAGPRCDIYSLAATLYQAVTGVLPFQAHGPLDTWMKKVKNEIAAPRELVPALSPHVDAAIRRAMSPEPFERPETCLEFVADLAGQGSSRPVAEAWYVSYVDEEGRHQTEQGTADEIRRALAGGVFEGVSDLGLARNREGPFAPPEAYAEFNTPPSEPTRLPPPPPEPPSAPPPPAFRAALPTMMMKLDDEPDRPCVLDADEPATDWLSWAALALVSAAAGVGGYFFMPYLTRRR